MNKTIQLRSAENVLAQPQKIERSYQESKPQHQNTKWQDVNLNFNSKDLQQEEHGEFSTDTLSLQQELDRLKNQLGKVNRYEDLMTDLRKVSDKKFVMEMDDAIGNVNSNRMPSKREMNQILEKHVPNIKNGNKHGFSQISNYSGNKVKKSQKNRDIGSDYSDADESQIAKIA